MRILLIMPAIQRGTQVTPPLGLGYLAALARQAGHEVCYLGWVDHTR